MADEQTSWESKLIDLHLGQLDASELHEVEEAVAGDPRLASRSRALRELLSLLERDAAPQPPARPDPPGSGPDRSRDRRSRSRSAQRHSLPRRR